MTQEPNHAAGLTPDTVAELEHKLADAAAQVARVKAQLAQAQAAPGQPMVPGGQIPPVPYGGSEPHAITIDGQHVVPGSGNLAAVLQALGGGAAGTTAPVVVVNGQNVSTGQPVDLSSYLNPEVAQQLQSSLHQLGLDGRLGALFGHAGPPTPPDSTSLTPLADPPRPVPAVLKLSTFAWSWWELFALLMGVTAPIALWLFVPEAFSVALVVAVVGVVWFRVRRYRRLGLLKHGKVATVTNAEAQSVGTYYSGVTLQNMRVPQARGWKVTRAFYSGPSTTTKIDYTVDGAAGSLVLRGLPYDQGVVLADPRHPERAACVSQFPFSMEPGPDGQLTGDLSVWSWLGVIAALFMESSLVAIAVLVVLTTWFR
jgi:hypothetical protein